LQQSSSEGRRLDFLRRLNELNIHFQNSRAATGLFRRNPADTVQSLGPFDSN